MFQLVYQVGDTWDKSSDFGKTYKMTDMEKKIENDWKTV